MLGVDLLRMRAFSLASVAAFCAYVTQGLALVALPFLFHHGLGFDQVTTGLLITPWPVMGALMVPLAGWLADRHPSGLLGGAGLLCLAGSVAALATMPGPAAPLVLGGCMGLCGLGFGLFLSSNQRALMRCAPAPRSGAASGILGISRVLGQATGAILVALHLRVLGEAAGPAAALWVGSGFAVAGALASALSLAPGRHRA